MTTTALILSILSLIVNLNLLIVQEEIRYRISKLENRESIDRWWKR